MTIALPPDRFAALNMWRRVTLDVVRGDEPDLTARQMAVLMTVYLTPPPHTVRGLAEALNVAKPAITRALDALGEYGFVRRKKDEADGRNVFIQRTVKGAVYLSDFSVRIERSVADDEPATERAESEL